MTPSRPRQRVVLLDAFGELDDVAEPLAGLPVEVVRAKRVPSGPGVVALLPGPRTKLTAEQVAALPDLRVVAVTAIGYDHIPVQEIAAAGAWVTTSAGYCTDEVAEHTLAFVLGLLRKVTVLDRSVRQGRWDVLAARPRTAAGSVLGVVGFGRIGQAVADRAAALGMRVAAYAPKGPDDAFEERAVERHDSLTALLAAADVVSLHLPLTPATEGIIDADALAAMKPGAYLVNVSRGGLVDHRALADALRSGHLAGAALDVLPTEPPPPGEPLLALPDVIVNPHAAWYSPEARRRPFRMAAAYVADVLSGREPAGAIARPRPASRAGKDLR
ncbi:MULTISPECIES: C-terminal binding protein [Streptomyces]|uniref:D-3-phosphoglycerate dehydrogenase n=2 Tax=Streptomyces TaxID=1883 RepID=A0ABT9KWC3_9ACTN|nr:MULTISPECIES: C-terminal binding protein [Streptomyces]MBW8090813.1 C-terminal binding protein [Streptomyces hygroscopicus subsp. hygroscopicus]MCO8307168.1 C-terminal binding protein [Streptomyces sp. RKCA744]MDN3060358.1 C-terminal binding protein [Streptomyces sp. SRF1]MDP9612735.1 D-3-phosphoglycerate dehydrogenase [Streptomyces demainii]GHJ26909.1 glycerate dehydrogenase [Streptomyces hygroscopicus]